MDDLQQVCKEAGKVDGASLEGTTDYLSLVGELTQTASFDSVPLVRGVWTSAPGFWVGRSALAGAVLTVISLVFQATLLEGGGGAVLLVYLLGTNLLVWVTLALAAARDGLQECCRLGLGDQLRRWSHLIPKLHGVILLHFLAWIGATRMLFLLASSRGAQEHALLLSGAIALVIGLNLFYALSEAALTHQSALQACLAVVRARVRGLVGAGFRRRWERLRLWRFLAAGLGQSRLLQDLFTGGLLAASVWWFFFCLAAVLVLPHAALGLAATYATLVVTLMILDYTACQFGGHYLVFLADRRALGEILALARARGEDPPGALPLPHPLPDWETLGS